MSADITAGDKTTQKGAGIVGRDSNLLWVWHGLQSSKYGSVKKSLLSN